MTETQATSGNTGASTAPAEESAPAGGAGGPATGRAAVGRATVPADAPAPKFTRAPGMPPPPDRPADADADGSASPAADAATSAGTRPVTEPTTAGRPGGDRPEAGGSAPDRPVAERATRDGRVERPAKDGDDRPTTTLRPDLGRPLGTPGRPGAGGRGYAGGAATGSAAGSAAVGAARVTEAVRAARSTVSSAASRGPRRARLNLKRIDPWSVMKFSFVVSLVLFIVVIVATSVLYLALDAMGVFESVNSNLTDLISAGGGQDASTLQITARGVILTSALVGLVNVVLFTALATLGAFIYNVCADLVGGVELTLAERD